MQNLGHHRVYMIYPLTVVAILPDGMDTLFQLQCMCSISDKVLHQVQLLDRASLESS